MRHQGLAVRRPLQLTVKRRPVIGQKTAIEFEARSLSWVRVVIDSAENGPYPGLGEIIVE